MDDSIARRLAPPLLIAVALLIAYSNAWDTAFVFDDHRSIVGNPVVVSESPWVALVRPDAGTVGGSPLSRRPLSAFSFALNHRLFGMNAGGFRAVNLLLHFASSWLLFGLLRRTFARCTAARIRRDALPLAAAIALLWAVHPLQTAVVTYTVQRAEGLAGFFYLTTLLCFVRAADARAEKRRNVSIWIAIAVVACFAGMASKEVMVSAPLTVLLYDRVFVSGSFREVRRRHGMWHLALFSSWVLLAVQVVRLILGNQLAGSYMGSTPVTYLVSQAYFLCRYVFLVFWPGPLVFDYGFAPILDPRWIVPCGAMVLGALGATLWAWRRSRRA